MINLDIYFNSSIISFSSPLSPSSENLGACLVEVAKWQFPLPPLPPVHRHRNKIQLPSDSKP